MFRRFFLAAVVLCAMTLVVAGTASQEEAMVSGARQAAPDTSSDPGNSALDPTAASVISSADVAPRSGTGGSKFIESDSIHSDTVESDNTDADTVESDNTDADTVESDNTDADTVELVAELRQTPALPPAQGLDDLAAASAKRVGREPVSVTIERLGLDQTRVRAEGVEESGEMAVPPAQEVGWYKFGPIPGEPGSAVLAGHVAFDGVDGAFRYLDDLEEGDQVIVDRQDGTKATFVVSDQIQVAKTNLPFDELFARSGPSRLALITCGGEFDYEARSYSDNVVVIADLVTT